MPLQYETHEVPYDIDNVGKFIALAIRRRGSTRDTCHYIGGLRYASRDQDGSSRFRPARPLGHKVDTVERGTSIKLTGPTAISPQPPRTANEPIPPANEDCLRLNIYIPKEPNNNGHAEPFPVLFYIHGGFLQFGSPNMDPRIVANLIDRTPFRAIIVIPTYRVSAFGFLASRELADEACKNGQPFGNIGFWDQRMALEWTKRNINALGGDPQKITVAGYSAGSHSTFYQLAYDIRRPNHEQCIARVIMWSNSPGWTPKDLPETQEQFDELLTKLDISLSLSAEEKLRRLRALPWQKVVSVLSSMKLSQFRALNDGVFIDKDLTRDIMDGTFARQCKARGIKILNGECSSEWGAYGNWMPPTTPSLPALAARLNADYPMALVNRVKKHYFPEGTLPPHFASWRDAFGRVYADLQVYIRSRGVAASLDAAGFEVGRDLLRYRIEWRAKCVKDGGVPESLGVTHFTDMAIWFWGYGWGKGLTGEEEEMLRPWNDLFTRFVAFEDVALPVKGPAWHLRLDKDGRTGMARDARWEEGLKIWRALELEVEPSARL